MEGGGWFSDLVVRTTQNNLFLTSSLNVNGLRFYQRRQRFTHLSIYAYFARRRNWARKEFVAAKSAENLQFWAILQIYDSWYFYIWEAESPSLIDNPYRSAMLKIVSVNSKECSQGRIKGRGFWCSAATPFSFRTHPLPSHHPKDPGDQMISKWSQVKT